LHDGNAPTVLRRHRRIPPLRFIRGFRDSIGSTTPSAMSDPFTHFDAQGQAHMVDVADKAETRRVARAEGCIVMRPDTLARILAGDNRKGDVIGIARIAAIQGAKRTADLIPLCHPIPLTRVSADFTVEGADTIRCTVTAETVGRTGVEMEALTAVQCGRVWVWVIPADWSWSWMACLRLMWGLGDEGGLELEEPGADG